MILVKAAETVGSTERGWKVQAAKDNGVSAERIGRASQVQQYAPEMVEEVIGGDCSLDTA